MSRIISFSELSGSERSVSFSTVEVHEHAMILGCSPATSHGPPLEIGWEQMNSAVLPLDDYEDLRPPRRIKDQLVMPGNLREEVLMESGYTKNQINHHLQRMKDERKAGELSFLSKLPIRMLGRARRVLTARKTKADDSIIH